VLVFSSSDADSALCVEKLKNEIEKSRTRELCHFVLVDNLALAHFVGECGQKRVLHEIQQKYFFTNCSCTPLALSSSTRSAPT
jgi:hypothetical protein